MFEKILTYIRKIEPNYVYNFNDFQIMVSGSITELVWNPDFRIQRPTDEQLAAINDEELNVNRLKESIKCFINVVNDQSSLLAPSSGALALINNVLSVYKDGAWHEI